MKLVLRMDWSQIYRVWLRNFIIFRRTWMISLFWIVLEPLFMLTAMGFGLGTYIRTMGGLSYVEFFFPALLCSSAMMVSFFEGTYGSFTKLSYSKVYSAQLISPVTISELILGELFWGATKGTLSCLGIIIIGSFFGLVQNAWIFPAIPVMFLTAWIFTTFGMVVTSYVHNFDQIIYPTSGLIVPMSLFSGTFFPLTNLNIALRSLILISPLTHSVDVVRTLLVTGFEYRLLVNLGVLAVIALVLTRYAIVRMTKRLQQ